MRGEWREIAMSGGIKALVVLNLQSYAGGRDLWGLRDPKRDAAKGWQTPIFNDGLIEVSRRSPGCPEANPKRIMAPPDVRFCPGLWGWASGA